MLAIVFAVGFGHAALYALAVPPWAIEDEQQHVDYAWKIANDHRLPVIEDEIDADIIDAIFGADRFSAYDMDRPEPTPEMMGLQARSYAAYHPPAAYALMAPVIVVSGGRALLSMYLLRFLSALAAGVIAALTAQLALDVGRRHRPGTVDALDATRCDRRAARTALGAGLAMAALPTLADSGGRVNADIYATLIVVIGCLVVLRWVARPTAAHSWWLGIVLTVAVLTRETALVLAIPLIIAIAVLVRSGRWSRGVAGRTLVAPAVAAIGWAGYQWRVTGHVDGSRAFLERYGDVVTLPLPRPLLETVSDAWLVPYGRWAVPVVVVVALVAIAVCGLALLARSGGAVVVAVVVAMLAFVVLALGLSLHRDLNIVTSRLLLPAYPAVVAAATVGWATTRARWAPFALAVPTVAFGLWFGVFQLLDRFPLPFG